MIATHPITPKPATNSVVPYTLPRNSIATETENPIRAAEDKAIDHKSLLYKTR